MALAISNCPKPQLFNWNRNPKCYLSISPASFVRLSKAVPHNGRLVCTAAASSAGSSSSDGDWNPYEVLGVSPIVGFDKIKQVYTKKLKDAERAGDEATASRLEMAYDRLMMEQLSNRKKGVTYGSFQVSKDIKYADKQPIVPWGPRFYYFS